MVVCAGSNRLESRSRRFQQRLDQSLPANNLVSIFFIIAFNGEQESPNANKRRCSQRARQEIEKEIIYQSSLHILLLISGLLSFGFLSFLRLASDYNNPAVNKKRNQKRDTYKEESNYLFVIDNGQQEWPQ